MQQPRDATGHDAAASRWTALVGLLRADADALVAEFVDSVRAIPPYGRGVVPHAVLEADADRSSTTCCAGWPGCRFRSGCSPSGRRSAGTGRGAASR